MDDFGFLDGPLLPLLEEAKERRCEEREEERSANGDEDDHDDSRMVAG